MASAMGFCLYQNILKGAINTMEFKEIVARNRSYRGYDESRKVTKDELEYLVDCARLTASGMNALPFCFHIAYEQEELDLIQPLTKWGAALPDIALPHDGKCPTAFIVICQDKEVSDNLQNFRTDLGITAQTICLGATAIGLGGCMIANFNKEVLHQQLGLPEQYQPILLVAVGKPDEEVVIKEIDKGESTRYYRDSNDVHYVPKRKLKDILI